MTKKTLFDTISNTKDAVPSINHKSPAIELKIQNHTSQLFTPSFRESLDSFNRLLHLPNLEQTTSNSDRIDTASTLGANGWTVNDRVTPINTQEWVRIIKANGEESIADSFTDEDIEIIQQDALTVYSSNPEKFYLSKGFENYQSYRFTESAMFLLSFLDNRVTVVCPPKYKRKSGQCSEGITKAGEDTYLSRENKPILRMLSMCDYIPSFSAFAERLFCEKSQGPYDLRTGHEPPFLNRNWLMHGKMKRPVYQYECIQLINAIGTLIIIEEYIEGENHHGQTQNAHP